MTNHSKIHNIVYGLKVSRTKSFVDFVLSTEILSLKIDYVTIYVYICSNAYAQRVAYPRHFIQKLQFYIIYILIFIKSQNYILLCS